MLQSMTGFGRGTAESAEGRVTAEVRSVNHRYLDIAVRAPRLLGAFESDARTLIGEHASRGKVEVFLNYEPAPDRAVQVQLNRPLAEACLCELRQMGSELGLTDDITLSVLSGYPDILTFAQGETDEEALLSLALSALRDAISDFSAQRGQEGERLSADLSEKLDTLLELVGQVEARAPVLIEEYRQKLLSRIEEAALEVPLDEGRLALEVTLYADKICVDEELVRLRSHVEETKQTLLSGGNVGRKLDFLAQELNREANTILSKSTDAELAAIGIEMKTLIEKIREQVQNIE